MEAVVRRICVATGLGMLATAAFLVGMSTTGFPSARSQEPPSAQSFPTPENLQQVDLLRQSPEEAAVKSTSCVECHKDTHDPHFKDSLHIGCVDCHGGNAASFTKETAHVSPRFPEAWKTSANPVRSYALLNHENPEFIRFHNPGDLRVAHLSCGTAGCHQKEVLENRTSMMTHGCMLWSAALYNN